MQLDLEGQEVVNATLAQHESLLAMVEEVQQAGPDGDMSPLDPIDLGSEQEVYFTSSWPVTGKY